jgi:hypothetical protein
MVGVLSRVTLSNCDRPVSLTPSTFGIEDLTANFAARVHRGVDVDVRVAGQQVGDLRGREGLVGQTQPDAGSFLDPVDNSERGRSIGALTPIPPPVDVSAVSSGNPVMSVNSIP